MQTKKTRRRNTERVKSSPVGDESGQRTLLDENFEISLRTEVLQVVNPKLNKVSAELFGPSRLHQHLINALRHYRSANHGQIPPASVAYLKIGRRQL
ncbi:hypothetical protein U1Q18_015343 [Sarracenia purpurea var. burkii]